MKNLKLKILAVTVTAMLSSTATAAETLLMHHFQSPRAPVPMKILEPWAEKVKELSNGELVIEIFPAMTMGGKPSELYKQARDGTTDIAYTIAGYTPGVFPRSEVFELPTVHIGDSRATTIAIKENFDLIKDDFTDVVPLLIHVNAGNVLHTVDKKVSTVDDIKGLKLRTPSRTGSWYIEALGAEPVGMPIPDAPQALSKKAIDGMFTPFEILPPYKIHQLTKYSSEGEKGERFGASVFLMLMNKDKFDSLSPELQKVLLDSTDMAFSEQAGQVMMDIEQPGIDAQIESGGEVVKITEADMAKFNEVGETVVARWIEEANSKGLDGKAMVEAARASIQKNSK